MSVERMENIAEDLPAEATLDHVPFQGDAVGDYLKNIGKEPLLNAEQEVELSKTIEAGLYANQLLNLREEFGITEEEADELEWVAEQGKAAKDRMLTANTRLVVSIARKYLNRGMPLEDLIQEGNLGLIRAVEKFDYQKGYKFSTYGTWWIRQAITRGIAEHGSRVVRLPFHLVESISKMKSVASQLHRDLGREPEIEEIALELDVPAEKVKELMLLSREHVSLDKPVDDAGETSIGDLRGDETMPAADEIALNRIGASELADVLKLLPEREQLILSARYGFEGKQVRYADIGVQLGLSAERVRQVEQKALARLRDMSDGVSSFFTPRTEEQRLQDRQQTHIRAAESVSYRGNPEYEREEARALLRYASDKLAQEHRETLETYVTTSSKKVAAERLGINPNTFTAKLWMARQAIKTLQQDV